MLRQSLAIFFCLFSAPFAKEYVSVSDSTRCDRVPQEHRETCRASIRKTGFFDFYVLVSRPDKDEIEPVDREKVARMVADPSQGTTAGTPLEERKVEALEGIRTSVTIIAALDVATCILAVVFLLK